MTTIQELEVLEAEIVSIIERAGELRARPFERHELAALAEELEGWDARAARAGVRLELSPTEDSR